MSALLNVQDLEVHFPVGSLLNRQSVSAVAGVSFDVHAGEIFALVGESGSGKSTLARAINGLQSIHAGSITFESQRLNELSPAAMKPLRQRMAMMFQDPVGSLSPRMRVRDLIVEPLRIHGLPANIDEANRLLNAVGLSTTFADRYPHQLSGGQARRVGVARALALNPSLLIADEPTAGLDVSVQGEILNLLIELRQTRNLAIVFITHNLHVVNQIADTMAVMYLGRFVESGSAQQLFRQPHHPYTHALLSASPEPDPDKKQHRITLPSEVPSLLHRPTGCEFHTRCPWAQHLCSTEVPSVSIDHLHRVTCHTPIVENPTGQADENHH